MKVFFDTEFTGLRKDTTLISIGCVSEDGKTFYGECSDYSYQQVENNTWVKENVVKKLYLYGCRPVQNGNDWEVWGDSSVVEGCLSLWLSQWDSIEMWGDVFAYDWVLFRHLFWNNPPEHIYYIPFDLATLFKLKGVDPDVSRKEYAGIKGVDHSALDDAKIIKACYDKLVAL